MKYIIISLLLVISIKAPQILVVEDHKIMRFREGEFRRSESRGKMILEPLGIGYGRVIWCALERDSGASFFCHALGVTRLQFKNFMLDFLLKRCSYGCQNSLIKLKIAASSNICETFEKDFERRIGEIRSYVYKNQFVEEKRVTPETSEEDMKKFKEFHFFDFAEVKDKEERDRLLSRQNELWRRIVEDDFSHFSKFGAEMLPYLSKLYWLKRETFEKYPKILKICLQEDAREMVELYCGVRFSSEFAGPPEPLEDVFLPKISFLEKIETAATGVLESTQATATAALDCVLSLFSKKPTSVVTVPEAQAFLGKKTNNSLNQKKDKKCE